MVPHPEVYYNSPMAPNAIWPPLASTMNVGLFFSSLSCSRITVSDVRPSVNKPYC